MIMKILFTLFGFLAYLIAAYELFEAATVPLAIQSQMHFIGCGVFCAWGTASLAGSFVMDLWRARPAADKQ